MTLKMKQILPPEIDTKMDSEKQHSVTHHGSSGNISFREADTPKHCNKGDKGGMIRNGPHFQHPAYSQFQPPGQQGPHSNHIPGNYYGHPASGHPNSGHNHNSSVMVSPGGHGGPVGPGGPGPGYNNVHHGNYYPHHNNNTQRPPYPPYGNQGHMPYNQNNNYHPPPPYGNGGDRNSRQQHHSFNPHPQYHNQSNHNADFSRSVSSSFSENNKNNPPNPFQENMFEARDDLSIGAESDASWKNGLNAVASIEEEKFEARNGATTPVERICPTLSSDMSATPRSLIVNTTDQLKVSHGRLPPMSSLRQPPITSMNAKDDDLDLRLCSTGSSLLFGDDHSVKRRRDARDDKSNMRDPSPAMNFNNLSMKEERDAPPTKRNRCTSIAEERELYNTFSIDSMNSFGRESLSDFGDMNNGNSMKPSSSRMPDSERDDCERDLPASMPSWDIAGQDSFGGGCGFSVASNLTEGNADVVLGKSFSFSNDDEFPSESNATENKNSEDLDKIDPIASMNPSTSINLNRDGNGSSSHHDNFPPNSATWVTNSSSRGASFSVDSTGPGGQGPGPLPSQPQRFPPPPPSGRFGSMSPPFHDNRHGYPPPSPYGMPRQSNQFLPPPFHPPPSGMAGPPMTRSAPPPVYMMSSPHGNNDRSGGMKRTSSKLSKSGTFNWTKNDDTRLQDIMKKFKNPKDWKSIANEFGAGRTAKECNERWIRYLKPGVRKGQWQDHEDTIVIEAVSTCKEQPFTRWSDLAQKLPGRVGKQIRDRWVNHLNPNINHMPFTKEDDNKLWEGHKQLGKRWVEISTKFFNSSRSENHIKNRWYSASFKKFVSTEFGPNAYVPCDKKSGKKTNSTKAKAIITKN